MIRVAGRAIALLAAAALVAAFSPFDLDVDIPTGTPFDSIKIPKDTPTGGKSNETATSAGKGAPKAPAETPGKTVAEDPNKKAPPKPPSGLPGISAPSTIDYQSHLGWKPKDDMVEWKDPLKPATPTGPSAPDPTPEKWDLSSYPPTVPNDLYVYGVTRFLMVLLHPAQVSERELTEFLIEMGYPAYYAATGAKEEKRIKRMTTIVLDAVGPMVKTPPAKPAGKVAQAVYMDLLAHYAYEPEFASWILNQPAEVTLPVLLDIVRNHKHQLLVRNAVFVLRCYNSPELVPPLRELLMRTQDRVIRNRALAALVRWQDAGIVEWLRTQIGGADLYFRSYAVWALGRIGDPGAIDALIGAAKLNAGDGEYLWAAIPALAWLGEKANAEQKKKIEDALVLLGQAAALIKDPPAWDGTGVMATRAPDPPNALSKILVQRCRIALARIGRGAEVAAVKGWTSGDVLRPNVDFYKETLTKLP